MHSSTGQPSLFGLFFADKALTNDRAAERSDYPFYDQVAYFLHDSGLIVAPESRGPWFMHKAHGLEETCLTDTLKAAETAVDLTLETLGTPAP